MADTILQDNQLLRIICSVFDAYSAVLFLPNEDGDGCRLTAAFSLGDKVLSGTNVSGEKGLVGWISRNREPMLVANVEERQVLGYYDGNEESSIKAFMGVPVADGGVLCVDSKRQYSFQNKDQKILQLFAEMLEEMLVKESREPEPEMSSDDCARYFSELAVIQNLRFKAKGWASYISRFMKILTKTTEFDYSAFVSRFNASEFVVESESTPLLLQDGEQVARPMGGNLVGCVFRTEEMLAQTGLTGDQTLFGRVQNFPHFDSVICAPVRVNRTTRAVICLASEKQRDIDSSLRSFVEQSVGLLSQYIEILSLKSRMRSLLPQGPFDSSDSENED